MRQLGNIKHIFRLHIQGCSFSEGDGRRHYLSFFRLLAFANLLISRSHRPRSASTLAQLQLELELFRRFQARLTATQSILQTAPPKKARSNLGDTATDGIFLGLSLMDCPGTGVVMKSLKRDFLRASCLIKDPIRRLQDRTDSKELGSFLRCVDDTENLAIGRQN